MLVLPLCFPSAGFAVSLSNNSAVFADSAPDEEKRARFVPSPSYFWYSNIDGEDRVCMRERGREGEGMGERPRERDEDERAQHTSLTTNARARSRSAFCSKQNRRRRHDYYLPHHSGWPSRLFCLPRVRFCLLYRTWCARMSSFAVVVRKKKMMCAGISNEGYPQGAPVPPFFV